VSNIFLGKGLTLQYNEDTGNRSPQGIGNVTISEVNTFPVLTISSEINSFETYDSDYKTVLLSDKSVQPFDIVVNYLPDSPSHQYLDNAAHNQLIFQIIIQYALNLEENHITYAIVNGAISGSQLAGDKDSVATKSYKFTPQDVVARAMSINALLPIYQGDYGVGSNTTDVPQYATNVPTGNSFIKVPSTQAGNPAGTDMMGVGFVDGTAVSSLAMTKTGTLSIFAKNASTAWTRIYTATQMDARYVPLTRTVNGKALTGNVVLNSSDTGSLAVEKNLNDVADAQAARENLDVYSRGETDASLSEMQVSLSTAIDDLTESTDTRFSDATDELNALALDVSTTYVPKTNTVNGHALSGNVEVTKADVGLNNVTNDAQLKIASNLGDLGNVATARGNLALDRFVQEQTLSYVHSGSAGNRLFVSSTGSWGVLDNTGNPIPLPLIYGGTGANSVSGARTNLGLGTASVQNIGTSGATIPLLNGSNTWTSQQTFSTSVAINTLNLTNALSVNCGGTGANNAAGARANLSLDIVEKGSAWSYYYSADKAYFIAVGNSGGLAARKASDNSEIAWSIANGGTGGTTQAQAQNNLGLGIGNAPQFYGSILGSTNVPSINNLRLMNQKYGLVARMDNSTFYLLPTAEGDPTGPFGSLRPLIVDLSTGEVTLNNLRLVNSLAIAQGGTGSTSVVGARTNLDVYSKSESDAIYGEWMAYTDSRVTPYLAFTNTSSSIYELRVQLTRNSIKIRGIIRKTLDAVNRGILVVMKPLPGYSGYLMPYCPVLASQGSPVATYVDAITSVSGAPLSLLLAGNAATTWVMVDFEISMV